MAITSNEIKYFKPKTVIDSGTNGGRLSNNQVTSNSINNLFGNVSESEQTAGSTKYRKLFYKVDDSENSAITRVLLFLDDYASNTKSRAVFWLGTQRDTQVDITGTERKYSTGRMNAPFNVGISVITVDYETGSAADTVVQSGDTVFIRDDLANREHTVASVTWAGETATITLNEPLNSNYASGTRVCSCLVVNGLAPTVTGFTVTSSLGTYDDTTYPILLEHQSTVEQSVTLTFTSATAFTATSDDGSATLGTGTIAGDFTPTNPNYSLPYFTLESAGFGGTFAIGDTIEFVTSPCAIPVWVKKITGTSYTPASLDEISFISATV